MPGQTGYGPARCDARRRSRHKPWKRTTTAAGWRAWCGPRCGRVEVELAFLDAVFHLAAGAVELLVEVAGLVLLARQRGDDKPRIGFAPCPFRLADDPALAAPALEGSPG